MQCAKLLLQFFINHFAQFVFSVQAVIHIEITQDPLI
jgi:hypothetical protein